MTKLEALYVEHLLKLVSDREAIRRAEQLLASTPAPETFPKLSELASLLPDPGRQAELAGQLLRGAVFEANPSFESSGAEAEEHARARFNVLCQQALRQECRPYDICRAVGAIESEFDFPVWLGDLYNQCDWIEPETRWSDTPHLLEYLCDYAPP